MNNALMFSKASDEWATPQPLFDELDREFHFKFDAAASADNKKCSDYLGLDHHDPRFVDALAVDWTRAMDCFEGTLHGAVWLNPPYSKCREFIAKASRESDRGITTVCLVPSRTDTRWWHDHVWFRSGPLDRVEVRFLKGRVKFGDGKNSAPFPSVVIVFRGAR
jgi:phage N-6-adenine-methyltransferase